MHTIGNSMSAQTMRAETQLNVSRLTAHITAVLFDSITFLWVVNLVIGLAVLVMHNFALIKVAKGNWRIKPYRRPIRWAKLETISIFRGVPIVTPCDATHQNHLSINSERRDRNAAENRNSLQSACCLLCLLSAICSLLSAR